MKEVGNKVTLPDARLYGMAPAFYKKYTNTVLFLGPYAHKWTEAVVALQEILL